MSGLELEPVLAAVPARLNQVFKKRRVSAQHLQISAFGKGDIRGNADNLDWNFLLGLFIETKRSSAAWQCRKEFDALHYPAQ